MVFQFGLVCAMCASTYLGFEEHEFVGQEGVCSVFNLLVYIMSTGASRKLQHVNNALVQATVGVSTVNFWSITVAWTRAGEPACLA